MIISRSSMHRSLEGDAFCVLYGFRGLRFSKQSSDDGQLVVLHFAKQEGLCSQLVAVCRDIALLLALRSQRSVVMVLALTLEESSRLFALVHRFKRAVYVFLSECKDLEGWKRLAEGPNNMLMECAVCESAHAVMMACNIVKKSAKSVVYQEGMRSFGEVGPFDIIGDVHGCYEELMRLVQRLGYQVSCRNGPNVSVRHFEGRRLVLLGDLVDRGPDSVKVLEFAMALVRSGVGFCVLGNHDFKLLRKMQGSNVQMTHGLEETWQAVQELSAGRQEVIRLFLSKLPIYLLLDQGALCVVHAGILDKDIGRMSARIKTFCLYGDITGKRDADGFPIRGDWSLGRAQTQAIVYGHTPCERATWKRNTINLDTACVFGGALTALRYPERLLLSEPSLKCYAPGLAKFNRHKNT